MRICVIRTIFWVAARSDADSIQPWLDVAARPKASPSLLRITLNITVPAARILRPVQREAIAHEPSAQIDTTN